MEFSRLPCRLALIGCLALTLLAASILAQAPNPEPPSTTRTGEPSPAFVPLYSLDRTPLLPQKNIAGTAKIAGALEEFVIELHPEWVKDDPEGFHLELPSGEIVLAYRLRSRTYNPHWMSWTGRVHDPQEDLADEAHGYLHLVYHGDRVSGVLNLRSSSYQVVGSAEGSHRLVRVGASAEASCSRAHPELMLDPPGRGLDRDLDPDRASKPEAIDNPSVDPQWNRQRAPTQAMTDLDLIVVYPRDVFTSAADEANLFAFVQTSISIANDIFSNSNVDASYNLVYFGPLMNDLPPRYDQIGFPYFWLKGQSGSSGTEISDLRNAYGADMLVLLIPTVLQSNGRPDACGIAELPLQSSPIGDQALSVHREDCGLNDLTFAHELGHNFGMLHDDDSSIPVRPNAFGYVRPIAGWASVMGCICGPSKEELCDPNQVVDAVCDRIPHFSDPAIRYPLGSPSGLATGTPGRNNANVARLEVGPYAAFRTTQALQEPSASFSFSCQGLHCTFDAGASFDSGGFIPASGYAWDFGEGSPGGEGEVVQHVFQAAGTSRVRLVLTDNSGQRDLEARNVTVSDSSAPRRFLDHPKNNVTISASQLVQGWATDESGVGSVTFLIDGNPVQPTSFTYGIPRFGACNLHASLDDPNCPNVGFQGQLDLSGLSKGAHTLTMISTDIAGNSASPVQRTIQAPCFLSAGHPDFCRDCGPCSASQGDCDGNGECAGNLFCQNDVGAQYGFDPLVDVCVAGCPWPVGHANYCRDCGPCSSGQGDCDGSGECASGLTCAQDVGAQYGFDPLVDVCVASCQWPLGHANYCRDCGPCTSGQGDCDGAGECAGGLACLQNVGAQYGFDPLVDVCG